MKFIDPKSDIAFKKIFGNEKHKNILLSFLNAVLNLSGNNIIQDVSVVNPYQVPRIEGLKETALDVKAIDKTGKEFIIEMQVREKEDFTKRALYYTAKTYTKQLKKGENYNSLRPVIFIGILNFNILSEPEFLTRQYIMNPVSLKQYIKDFDFYFIELPKFNKTESELTTIVDQWIYFLKVAPSLSVIPPNINEDIKEAFLIADQHTWTESELDIFEYWELEENTNKILQETKYEEGKEEGKEEGLKEGIEKGKELGVKEGKELGVKEGKELGVKEGKELGVKEGMEKAKQEMVNNLMKTLKITVAEAKKMLGI